jgi:TPR repeat protein
VLKENNSPALELACGSLLSLKVQSNKHPLSDPIDQQGLRELEERALADDPEAQYQLSLLYCQGKSVERDLDLCLKWMQLAEKNGHLEAVL